MTRNNDHSLNYTPQQGRVIACGQIISLFLCGTAVASQYLASDINIPTTQSALNYIALALVFVPWLAYRGMLWEVLRERFVLVCLSV